LVADIFFLQDIIELLFIVEYLAADFEGLELVFLGVVVEVAAVDAEVAPGVADGDVAQVAGFGALALELLVVDFFSVGQGYGAFAGFLPDLAVDEDGAAFALAGQLVVVDEVIDGLLEDAALFGELRYREIVVFLLLSREEFLQAFAAVVGGAVEPGQGDSGFGGACLDGLFVLAEFESGFVGGDVFLALIFKFLLRDFGRREGVALVGDALKVDAVGAGAEFDKLEVAAVNHRVDGGSGDVENPGCSGDADVALAFEGGDGFLLVGEMMAAGALRCGRLGFFGGSYAYRFVCGGLGPELWREGADGSGAELLEEPLVVGLGERPQFGLREEGFRQDGNLVPKYSLYRFHLYIIFRVCKECLGRVFVN